jgi:hypothetical protein
MKLMKAGVVAVGLAAVAVVMAACGGDSSSPAAPTTTGTSTSTLLFEGQLSVGGSAFYSFSVDNSGTTNVMLASTTTSTSPGTSANVVLGLGIGTPLATDCTVTAPFPVTANLQTAVSSNLTPGIYCVRVFDVGNMKVPLNFAIRIVHT